MYKKYSCLFAAFFLSAGAAQAATVGDASFSQNILCSWGSCHTFSVTSGPANTCGELNILRNGNWEFTGSWLCTDSSGNATKGPWCWQDKSNDETGDPVFIRWPNNDTTDQDFAIVDQHSAQTFRDSSWSSPPSSYYGHATDAQWGTGFDFGGECISDFRDLTTNRWWNPSTGTYSSISYQPVTASLSRVNRWYVNWTTAFPSPGSHNPTHTYEWYTCCTDGCGGGSCIHQVF